MGVWDAVKGIGGALLPLAGPIGGVASSVIDAVSQGHANKANAENVREQNRFNAEQSSTQYQRGVKDMEKAGLNPALAYQQGGDSAATAGAAQAQPLTQNTASKYATALQTYQDFASGSAQRDLMRANADAANAAAQNARIDAIIKTPEGLLAQQLPFQDEWAKMRHKEIGARAFTAGSTEARFKADIASIGAGTARAQAAAQESRNRSTLMEQEFQTEWFRKHIAPYINNASAGMHAAGKAAELLTKGRRNIFDITGR